MFPVIRPHVPSRLPLRSLLSARAFSIVCPPCSASISSSAPPLSGPPSSAPSPSSTSSLPAPPQSPCHLPHPRHPPHLSTLPQPPIVHPTPPFVHPTPPPSSVSPLPAAPQPSPCHPPPRVHRLHRAFPSSAFTVIYSHKVNDSKIQWMKWPAPPWHLVPPKAPPWQQGKKFIQSTN